MKKLELLFGLLRLPIDMMAVALALMLSYQLRLLNVDLIPGVQLLDPAATLPPVDYYLQSFVFPATMIFVVCALCLKLYTFQVTRSAWREVGRGLLAAMLWLVVVMAWYFLLRKQLFYSRILLLHSTFFIALFTIMSRSFLTVVYRLLLLAGYGVRWVVSLGLSPLPATVEDTLLHNPCYRYLGHLKSFKELLERNTAHPLDLVLQTDPNPRSDETTSLIDYCRSQHLGYAFLPPVLADVPHQLAVEKLGMLPMMRLQPTPLDGWGRVIKRFCDFLGGLILFIILLPVFLIIAVAVLVESGSPIFYISRRMGDFGRRTIPVIKFRSMVRGADKMKQELVEKNHRNDGPLFKMKHDPRVTRVGRVIRRFSLDEIPQLLNVIAGQMALVGPRPHLPEEVSKYTSYQHRVFAVRPGLTGLAQVSGRSDLTFAEEVKLDLQYIEEWSIFLDLWILWRTLVVVIGRRGAD